MIDEIFFKVINSHYAKKGSIVSQDDPDEVIRMEAFMMQVLTIICKDLEVLGFGPTKYQDLLVVQALLPGATIISSIRVSIDPNDPNKGILSTNQDPHLLEGRRRIKKDWKKRNPRLPSDLEHLFAKEVENQVVTGTARSHFSSVEQVFYWPGGVESQLKPIDPFVLGFRPSPTEPGRTLLDTEVLETETEDGKVVPAVLLTAFFLVEK
jgi:hypothetical protein